MNFNQLRRMIRPILDSGTSLELVSPPGRGKSTFVLETVEEESKRDGWRPDKPETEEHRWGYADLFLATQTPPDLIGYIMKGEREYNGKMVDASVATLPGWMFTREGKPLSHHKRGILFLDEYGQGEVDVKRASAELLLNKRLGPWKLPPGWSVVAASNRMTDRSGVTKSLDFVINRRMEIHITDDLASLIEWMNRNDVEPLFKAFAAQHPEVVFSDGVPEKQGPWCTPRSLVMCANTLGRLRNDKHQVDDSPEALEAAAGIIGAPAAQALYNFVRLENDLPKYADIVAEPTKTKLPTKPDAQMLLTYNLAHRLTEKDAKPVVTYMTRMPKDFAVTFIKAAVARMPQLVYEPTFEKWSQDNSSLLTAVLSKA